MKDKMLLVGMWAMFSLGWIVIVKGYKLSPAPVLSVLGCIASFFIALILWVIKNEAEKYRLRRIEGGSP